jgi:hypothetical protein
MTKREELCGLNGTEPDTVIVKYVPRVSGPCGRDALGRALSVGDLVVCLCCGSKWIAQEETSGDSCDYPGSSWVKAPQWLAEALAALDDDSRRTTERAPAVFCTETEE